MIINWSIVLTLITMVNLSSFMLGAILFFSKKGKLSLKQIVLIISSFSIYFLQVFFLSRLESTNILIMSISLVCLTLSFFMFFSCVKVNTRKKLSPIYSLDSPEHIQTQGLYKFVRHPFYVSYILTYLGGVIAYFHPVFFITFFIVCFIYYDAAKTEENKFAISSLSNEYEKYKEETGMFLPKLIKGSITGEN